MAQRRLVVVELGAPSALQECRLALAPRSSASWRFPGRLGTAGRASAPSSLLGYGLIGTRAHEGFCMRASGSNFHKALNSCTLLMTLEAPTKEIISFQLFLSFKSRCHFHCSLLANHSYKSALVKMHWFRRVHACVRASVDICVYMHACMFACIVMKMYACTCVCMSVVT